MKQSKLYFNLKNVFTITAPSICALPACLIFFLKKINSLVLNSYLSLGYGCRTGQIILNLAVIKQKKEVLTPRREIPLIFYPFLRIENPQNCKTL